VKLYVVSVHQVGHILGVRSKAEWAEDGTLRNAAVDREAECLAARVSVEWRFQSKIATFFHPRVLCVPAELANAAGSQKTTMMGLPGSGHFVK